MKKLIEVSLKSIIFFGDCYYDRHFLVCRS